MNHSDLVSVDPDTGLQCWQDHDPNHPGRFKLRYTQEVTPMLDEIATLANDTDRKRRGIKQGWWHVGHIPDVVWLKWKLEENIDIFNPEHSKHIMKKLQSPDYRRLMATSGRIA